MRRLTAAFLLVLVGCASSADDGAQDESSNAGNTSSSAGNASSTAGNLGSVAGNASPTGGLPGGGGQGMGGSANGGAGTNGAGGAGGSKGTSGSAGSAGAPNKDGGGATGSGGQVGVWENVTPAGISVDYNNPAMNFGVMDVVADPVRPSDFYVGVCYQGIWRSTDFGLTWKKVNTGTNAAVVDGGRPWSMVIDNNKNRDTATAPTLYTTDGYGSKNGVLKSIDGGVNWTVTNINLGAYSFDMDPYDNQHLVTGLHEAEGIAESTDGGTVWKSLPTAIGKSIYPHFIDTGSAATTRKTWLAVPQLDTGMSGMMTTDGGATFHSVGNFGHPHGGNQAFNAGGGVAYVGASGGGVWRTTDSGATWKPIAGSSDNGYKNGVIGTPGWLYAWDDGANSGGIGTPHLSKAPRNPGTAWTAVTVPAGFNNGGKTMATAFDGTHSVLVSGSWNAGIWRYVEP